MTKHQTIWCCGCQQDVAARLTSGSEVYSKRVDLKDIPFWRCDSCGCVVGCHYKTDNPTRPLGCLPTDEIKKARQHIHAAMDPLWQSGMMTRKQLYKSLAQHLGVKGFHTADIRSMEEARRVYVAIRELVRNSANSRK